MQGYLAISSYVFASVVFPEQNEDHSYCTAIFTSTWYIDDYKLFKYKWHDELTSKYRNRSALTFLDLYGFAA